MKITKEQFEVFERENLVYRVNTEGADKVKHDYKSAWNKWKEIVNESLKKSGSQSLEVESTENWQNSGNLSTRFWTRIKNKNLMERPSCIAAMIRKDNIRVYLEWHGYKNDSLFEERRIHNSWVDAAKESVKESDIISSNFKVWTNKDLDEESEKYISFDEFLQNEEQAKLILDYLIEDPKSWIRVGRIFPKLNVINDENIIEKMGDTIRQLEWIYNVAVGNPTASMGNSNNYRTEILREKQVTFRTKNDLTTHIYTYIRSKGFYYQKEEVINLYLSLKTKPFVILSGISGTGKTKMVQWFAESVGATEENGQFALIPIRPDWNDGSDLLGYRDIKGEFQKGPLTKVIERALVNPELPYFVLLDEMNLARVEYYFSDILSVMESRKWEDGKIVSSNLLTKEHADIDLKLPNNVYIIGTVNMDETTNPFSKKVLDRANTIEFNRVELDYLEFLKDLDEVDPIMVGQESFASHYLHLKDVYVNHPSLVERVTRELMEINKALQLINAHVGYRVRDEICFYLTYNQEGEFMTFEEAMDHCLLQKVLPRIAGSDQRVEDLLKQLYLHFANKPYDDTPEQVEIDRNVASYPQSAAKVAEMLRGLRDGFTSFWIS